MVSYGIRMTIFTTEWRAFTLMLISSYTGLMFLNNVYTRNRDAD